MKRRLYQKPSVKVYELRQTPRILAGSGLRSTHEGYNKNSAQTWEEE